MTKLDELFDGLEKGMLVTLRRGAITVSTRSNYSEEVECTRAIDKQDFSQVIAPRYRFIDTIVDMMRCVKDVVEESNDKA